MKYFQTKEGLIIDENHNIIIMDENNQEYQDYLSFLISNGTVEETDIVVKPPLSIDELKQMQYNELAITDWYYIRKIDIGVEIPEEIVEQRIQIRNKYNNLINIILNK